MTSNDTKSKIITEDPAGSCKVKSDVMCFRIKGKKRAGLSLISSIFTASFSTTKRKEHFSMTTYVSEGFSESRCLTLTPTCVELRNCRVYVSVKVLKVTSCVQKNRTTSGSLCCGFRHSAWGSFYSRITLVMSVSETTKTLLKAILSAQQRGSNESARCFSFFFFFQIGYGDISTSPLPSVTGSRVTFTVLIKSVNCSVFQSNLTAKQYFFYQE